MAARSWNVTETRWETELAPRMEEEDPPNVVGYDAASNQFSTLRLFAEPRAALVDGDDGAVLPLDAPDALAIAFVPSIDAVVALGRDELRFFDRAGRPSRTVTLPVVLSTAYPPLRWSAEGTTLAIGDGRGLVLTVDVETGEEVSRLRGDTRVLDVSLDRRAAVLAAAFGDGTSVLYDLVERRRRWTVYAADDAHLVVRADGAVASADPGQPVACTRRGDMAIALPRTTPAEPCFPPIALGATAGWTVGDWDPSTVTALFLVACLSATLAANRWRRRRRRGARPRAGSRLRTLSETPPANSASTPGGRPGGRRS